MIQEESLLKLNMNRTVLKRKNLDLNVSHDIQYQTNLNEEMAGPTSQKVAKEKKSIIYKRNNLP